MSLREALKQKKLAKEQAEVIEQETNLDSFSNEEVENMQEGVDIGNDIENQMKEEVQSEELLEEIDQQINANEELIEGEAEPTEAQVAQVVERAKHIAWKAAIVDSIITESITFTENNKTYNLAFESYAFNSKSNKEKIQDVNLVLEGIGDSIKNYAKDVGNQFMDTMENRFNWWKNSLTSVNKMKASIEQNKDKIKFINKPEDLYNNKNFKSFAKNLCSITASKLVLYYIGEGKLPETEKDFINGLLKSSTEAFSSFEKITKELKKERDNTETDVLERGSYNKIADIEKAIKNSIPENEFSQFIAKNMSKVLDYMLAELTKYKDEGNNGKKLLKKHWELGLFKGSTSKMIKRAGMSIEKHIISVFEATRQLNMLLSSINNEDKKEEN